MGRLKNAIGMLLHGKEHEDFLGEWIKEEYEVDDKRSGTKKKVPLRTRSRWIGVIGTSWRDISTNSQNVRVFVSISDQYFRNTYGRIHDHNDALRNVSDQIWEDLQKTTSCCVNRKIYTSTGVLGFTFTKQEAAEQLQNFLRYGSWNSVRYSSQNSALANFHDDVRENRSLIGGIASKVQVIDPEAIVYVEDRKSSAEDQIDVNRIGEIVSVRDENLVGKYYIDREDPSTIHLVYYNKGQRRISAEGTHYYEHAEEFWSYLRFDDFGTRDESISEPEVLEGVCTSEEATRLILSAFNTESKLMREYRARQTAQMSIVHQFIRGDRLNITAKFGAQSLTAVEKERQLQADKLLVKMLQEEAAKQGKELSVEDVLKQHPFLAEFIAKELKKPPMKVRGEKVHFPGLVMKKPSIRENSRLRQGGKESGESITDVIKRLQKAAEEKAAQQT
jgi:hypothetical protein